MRLCVKFEKENGNVLVIMNTRKQLSNQSNQSTVVRSISLPTRQQLEKFLQSKGIPSQKLGQMSTWEQIQLTREYQQLMARGQW